MTAPVRPEPGFDLYAPVIPPARRARVSAWVAAALVFAGIAVVAWVTFVHLGHRGPVEMHGTIHEGWTAVYGKPRREAKLETGDRP